VKSSQLASKKEPCGIKSGIYYKVMETNADATVASLEKPNFFQKAHEFFKGRNWTGENS